MGTHVYGFPHQDLRAARTVIESALSISMEEAEESEGAELAYYFRWFMPDGPFVQIRSNYGASLRWGGKPLQAYHPEYGVLVFVHGPARESITERLQQGLPGLSFLEKKGTT